MLIESPQSRYHFHVLEYLLSMLLRKLMDVTMLHVLNCV